MVAIFTHLLELKLFSSGEDFLLLLPVFLTTYSARCNLLGEKISVLVQYRMFLRLLRKCDVKQSSMKVYMNSSRHCAHAIVSE